MSSEFWSQQPVKDIPQKGDNLLGIDSVDGISKQMNAEGVSRIQSAIHTFSASENYKTDDIVINTKIIYIANQDISPGAFSAIQWDSFVGRVYFGTTSSHSSSTNPDHLSVIKDAANASESGDNITWFIPDPCFIITLLIENRSSNTTTVDLLKNGVSTTINGTLAANAVTPFTTSSPELYLQGDRIIIKSTNPTGTIDWGSISISALVRVTTEGLG